MIFFFPIFQIIIYFTNYFLYNRSKICRSKKFYLT